MENKILPDEIKEILKEVDINPNVASAIWKKDSIYMIQNTIEYDQERLFNEIPGDRKQKIVEAVRKMEVEEDPLQYIISSALGCFVIESVIRGQDFIDLSIVNKIGINNKMRMGKGKYYTYAACHHCYNTVKKVPANYIVYSPCYRIEEYYNNYRKEKFNMFEIVTFDEFNKIESSKLEFIFFICEILNRNNANDYKISLANDSFITDNKEKLLYQILSKSKIEILCFSKQETRYISVASVNMHRKSFIQKFHITRNPLFESMCFGIGIKKYKNMFDEYNQIKV